MNTIPDLTDSTKETPATPEPPAEKRRVRVRELDLRNTWQVIAGAVLLPLGVAVIILGWHGAAYGNVDQKQIPYLISGGVLGLAIVIVGCFFYWGHWLYRIYDQADLHHQEALEEQRELMSRLLEALATGASRMGPGPGEGTAVAVGVNGLVGGRVFVATQTGTNFHTPACPMVANRSGNLRTVSEEEAEEMKPCRVCEPLVLQ